MCKKVTMLGKKFGRLLVVGEAVHRKHGQLQWHCVCECGNKKPVIGHSLRSGRTQSCGCLCREKTREARKRDIIDRKGLKYGRLTVIKYAGSKHKGAQWLCECECGETKVIDGQLLQKGSTKSCGCIVRLPSGKASFNVVYKTYVYSAKKRELEFTLTKEQFKHLTTQNCLYCGAEPSREKTHKNANGSYTYNGIDRVDNSQGYTAANCVPCCRSCNVAKSVMSLKEYFAHIVRSYLHIQPLLAPGFEGCLAAGERT